MICQRLMPWDYAIRPASEKFLNYANGERIYCVGGNALPKAPDRPNINAINPKPIKIIAPIINVRSNDNHG